MKKYLFIGLVFLLITACSKETDSVIDHAVDITTQTKTDSLENSVVAEVQKVLRRDAASINVELSKVYSNLKTPPKFIDPNITVTSDMLMTGYDPILKRFLPGINWEEVEKALLTGDAVWLKQIVDAFGNNGLYAPGDLIISVNIVIVQGTVSSSNVIGHEYVITVAPSTIEDSNPRTDYDVVGNPFGYSERYWKINQMDPGDVFVGSITHVVPPGEEHFTAVTLGVQYIGARQNGFDTDCTNNHRRVVVGIDTD